MKIKNDYRPKGWALHAHSEGRMKRSVCLLSLLCVAMAIASGAQTYTALANFDGVNGTRPLASLVQGLDGKFYGTTFQGGPNNWGTVFKISSAGELTTLYNFCEKTNCHDGDNPAAPLVLATDGNFYGTTDGGGGPNHGVIFKITPAGKKTTLYSFCAHARGRCGYGPGPSPLIQGTDGNFYGTSPSGASGGFIYKVTPQGSFTVLYIFTHFEGPDGALVQALDGNFYGTTYQGGTHGGGTVFKITPGGQLTTLYNFCSLTNCADGANPEGALVQAANGIFYGTAGEGGATNSGTVFKMTPEGQLTTIHSFCTQTGCPDGGNPVNLLQGPGGNFYGIATVVAFKITPMGKLTPLYTFDTDPNEITLGTDGKFYGNSEYGGTNKDGVVFSLAVGLGPFVETVPTSGNVGTIVNILGTKLTNATSVSFNGTPATFTVASGSEITATVPTGATTGKVVVTTPEHKLSTNVVFRITTVMP